MKYLLIIYETYNDGTADRKTIKDYEVYNEALAIYHNELYKAISAENVSHLLIQIIGNGMGEQYRSEAFNRDTTVPNVEE